jgi:hypothetical protein
MRASIEIDIGAWTRGNFCLEKGYFTVECGEEKAEEKRRRHQRGFKIRRRKRSAVVISEVLKYEFIIHCITHTDAYTVTYTRIFILKKL